MPRIQVVDTGIINNQDSAFPTLVRLDSGDLLAGFSVGGGPNATGSTECARSRDGGKTWSCQTAILPRGKDPDTTSSLRLSRTADGTLLAYGARVYPVDGKHKFGHQIKREPVLCRSTDGGFNWSRPEVIPSPVPGPFEVSNPVVVLQDGRWLAPAATLAAPERLGEQVVAFISEDQGKTWGRMTTVMRDPEGVKGFFEQKVIELEPGRILAAAWTVRMGDYSDLEDHFAVSNDGGQSWGPALPTGIRGQTLTPVWLGGDRMLVLYNRRYGQQGVQMCLVRFNDTAWTVEYEGTLWDATSSRQRSPSVTSGIDEFDSFAFGLPSALRLDEETLLAVHWCKESGVFGIRWTRIHVALS